MNDPDLSDIFAIKPPRSDGETRFDFSLYYEKIGAPPAFPLDVLPRLWGPWCEGTAQGASTPADYVALALLGSTASLVGATRRVTPAPGWSEPCILWTALVGPPSSGKTPAIDAVLRLVRALKPPSGRDAVPAPTPPATSDGPVPAAPPHPVVVSGSSVEAVAGVLQSAPRGVLLARDEHGDWLPHMVRGTRDGRAHAFWLSAWAGRACSVGQRGRAIALADPAVSILGTAQPEALEQALARDHDGMLARFLFVRPTRAGPHALPATDVAVSPEAVAALRRLRDMPAARRDLSLSVEALAAFEAFRREHHDALEDLAGRGADWWGKGPGTVLRLAGVLTFLDWAAQPAGTAEPAQVPAWALRNAARLWRDCLWPHAQATLRIAGAGGERERHVRKVVRWLRLHGPHIVSRETLRRDALGQALDAAATDRVIDALVEGGFLEPAAPAPGTRGRRPLRWRVFPGLWHEPELPSAGLRPHPEPVEGSSDALPAAQAENEGRASTHAPAIPAVSATPGSTGACPEAPERVPPAFAPGEGLARPPIRYDDGPMPPRHGRGDTRAPGETAIPAVSATSHDTGVGPDASKRVAPAVARGQVNGANGVRPPVRY